MKIELFLSGVPISCQEEADPPAYNIWRSLESNHDKRKQHIDKALLKFKLKYKNLIDLNPDKTAIAITLPSRMNAWTPEKIEEIFKRTPISKRKKQAA
jgi:hypothetical protein